MFGGIGENFSGLYLNGVYTGNRYTFYISLSGEKNKGRESYWRHRNTPLLEKMKHNTQC